MSDLNLSVILSAVDRLSGPLRRIAANTRQAFEPLNRPVRELGTRLDKVGREAGRLTTRLTAVGAATGFAFKRLFIDTAAQFERYQVMLRSLEGSNAAAERSMAWVNDFANRVPLELGDVMDAFVKLRTFGMDPMNGTLQALVDQNAKMGGSGEKLQGIILALGQAWVKQKLQGEEVMQLTERGVPVWDLLAKRSGKTAAQLQEMASKGQLGRAAIKALIEEMGKASAGAAQDQAKTWDGMVSNISDQWTRFSNLVMKAGVFDWLKTRLKGVLDTLNAWAASGRLEQLARQVSERMVQALESLWAALKEIWSVAQQVGAGLRWLHDLFGSWRPVIAALAAVIAGPLLLALTSAGIALGKLGFLMLTTPVGQFLALIGVIVAAAGMITGAWNPIAKFFPELWDKIVDTVGGAIAALVGMFDTLTETFMAPFNALFSLVDKAKSLLPSWLLSSVGLGGNAATLGAQRAEVGGTIRVEVNSEGRARVREVRASGGIGIEADTGRMQVGAN